MENLLTLFKNLSFKDITPKDNLTLILLGILALIIVILFLILKKSSPALYKAVVFETDKLQEIISNAKRLIPIYQDSLFKNQAHASKKALNNLGIIRNLVHALENRTEELNMLIKNKSARDTAYAAELLEEPLDLSGNYLNTLLFDKKKVSNLPKLTPVDCEAILESLFLSVEEEIIKIN